jgi:hypothetical protein
MTGRYRALLLGIPTYDDRGIRDLPCVARDITELASVLETAGYQVIAGETGRTGLNALRGQLHTFIGSARRRDTLLIYLSGHGVHHAGADYLVPSDVSTAVQPFARQCLELDLNAVIEASDCGDVLILVDACREGFDEHVKGNLPTKTSWSKGRITNAGNRHVEYLFACSPGQTARYVPSDDGPFSLFSRALTTAITAPDRPATVDELLHATQERLDDLIAKHGGNSQTVRRRGETDPTAFIVFPSASTPHRVPATFHPWATGVAESPVWERIAKGPAAATITAATIDLVDSLGHAYDRDTIATADPWRDDNLALRMSEKVQFLLTAVLDPVELDLSPAEAALLTAAPFLRQAVWTRFAATLAGEVRLGDVATPRDSQGPGATFGRFAAGYPRLLRRVTSDRDRADGADASAGIGWWLFHRWLERRPKSYQPAGWSELLAGLAASTAGPLPTVFDPDRLAEQLRAMSGDPDLLTRSDRPTALQSRRMIAASTPHEQPVRERLVGCLLAVAYQMAIDPAGLSDVVVEHLGITTDWVDLSDVHTTITAAQWQPRGRTRVLSARCAHPAVDLALHDHAARLDRLLTAIHTAIDADDTTDRTLTPLAALPSHASADQVTAILQPDGQPAYGPVPTRFRLNEDQIRELLMGERLYGEPALATGPHAPNTSAAPISPSPTGRARSPSPTARKTAAPT